jgi:hypothetical protein
VVLVNICGKVILRAVQPYSKHLEYNSEKTIRWRVRIQPEPLMKTAVER